MRQPSPSVLYYGSEEPLPRRVPLRAGPLSLVYEAGDLRYIRLGRDEILRRVYVAVRDHNWATIVPRLDNVRIERGDQEFRVSYDAIHQERDVDFAWHGTIEGSADGTIRFVMAGEVRSNFRRNRIGFCILHPGSCAGRRYVALKSDGSLESSVFPVAISPNQPVMDLRAFRHEIRPGVEAEIQFEGDVFEMEDQRNWTDASFKTYCTPLALPYPVAVTSGTRIDQTVILRLQGAVSANSSEEEPLRVSVGAPSVAALPQLGFGLASHGHALTAREVERLRGLALAHLRVDLDLSRDAWQTTLVDATDQARALEVQLEIAIALSNDAQLELAALRKLCDTVRPPVARWLIFQHSERSLTSECWIQFARAALGDFAPTALIGSGTDQFFTQLNRQHPPTESLDLVCYSINPQVHAFDNASLVETLEAQGWTVASARAIAENRPIAVTPVTLKMRDNPDASGPALPTPPNELPPQVDPRQTSLFGAGWTLGSLKYLAESGAYSVTYYETTGWRGVMETEAGSPLPEKFHSIPGGVFPLYHVLADVGEFTGAAIVPVHSTDTLAVDGLALQKNDRVRVLLANLTPDPQTVLLTGMESPVAIRVLDESNALEATCDPEAFRAQSGETRNPSNGHLTISLRPYAVARVDNRSSVTASRDATRPSVRSSATPSDRPALSPAIPVR